LRSLATGTGSVSYGTVVYLPEWNGIKIPPIGNLGGFVHDGCFRADDTSGSSGRNHFKLFVGTLDMKTALDPVLAAATTSFTMSDDTRRCRHLRR
jgi:hypothetical protein